MDKNLTIILFVALTVGFIIYLVIVMMNEQKKILENAELFEKRKALDKSDPKLNDYILATVIEKEVTKNGKYVIDFGMSNIYVDPEGFEDTYHIKFKTDCGKEVDECFYESLYNRLKLGDRFLVKI